MTVGPVARPLAPSAASGLRFLGRRRATPKAASPFRRRHRPFPPRLLRTARTEPGDALPTASDCRRTGLRPPGRAVRRYRHLHAAANGQRDWLVLCFAAAMAVIVGSALLGAGTHRRCPHCKRWWARVRVGSRILEQKRCYGLVTRTARSSSSGSYYGNRRSSDGGTVFSSGATNWQERVPVIRTTYELQYECRYCQASWTRNVEKEVEDFDRP